MSERRHWEWQPIKGATVGLFAPERYGLDTPQATITAVANEGGRIELLTHYTDADGVLAEGPVEKSATTAERIAQGLALEARIEWAHRQMLAARVALDAGHIEEALALMVGAERQESFDIPGDVREIVREYKENVATMLGEGSSMTISVPGKASATIEGKGPRRE